MLAAASVSFFLLRSTKQLSRFPRRLPSGELSIPRRFLFFLIFADDPFSTLDNSDRSRKKPLLLPVAQDSLAWPHLASPPSRSSMETSAAAATIGSTGVAPTHASISGATTSTTGVVRPVNAEKTPESDDSDTIASVNDENHVSVSRAEAQFAVRHLFPLVPDPSSPGCCSKPIRS